MLQDRRTARIPVALLLGRARLFAFLGPAALVSVGYMDPGNWATDLEGGARFGYQLLWVLVASNLMALLLQSLSARLGVVTGLDLAQACRNHYSRPVSLALWVLAELAIVACDLAEILGSAIALNMLFGIPMIWGALITVFDVFLILALQRRGVRALEAIIVALLVTIAGCLFVELFLAKPKWGEVAGGLVPRLDGASLYVAIGILGATLMPHNLYLHSSIVQTRLIEDDDASRRTAIRFNFIDTLLALNLALLVNAAILILAASVFHDRGLAVDDLRDAHQMLAPLLGTGLAAVLFAVALLCSGQSATITGTLAGQIVMEGFLDLRLSPALRRTLTRTIAIVPAVAVLALYGEHGILPLLIASQVVLSLQLPFAVIPLIRLTGSKRLMGVFATTARVRALAVACAALIIAANAALLGHTLLDWYAASPAGAIAAGVACLAAAALLAWITLAPLRSQLPGLRPTPDSA